VLAIAAIAMLALLIRSRWKHWSAVTAIAVLLTGLATPAAYAVQTAAIPHSGSIPAAGRRTARAAPSKEGWVAPAGRRVPTPRSSPSCKGAGTKWSTATVGAQGSATTIGGATVYDLKQTAVPRAG
jgi:hypothetical protein